MQYWAMNQVVSGGKGVANGVKVHCIGLNQSFE